jgi:hypothetical protein
MTFLKDDIIRYRLEKSEVTITKPNHWQTMDFGMELQIACITVVFIQ